jgi:hypothetical protein
MTSLAVRPDTPQQGGEDRASRRREAVNKAKERIRTATGKDGNGLKDAARRVSENVKSRMEGRKRPTPSVAGNVKEAAEQAPRREGAGRAAEMAREKMNQVKSAVSGNSR